MTHANMLGRYSILHELGRGATGAVYAARERTTGAVVAFKRLDPALLSQSDPNFARRVLAQVRSARHLSHRNIARMDDAGEAGGTVYIAMEMLEGESLRKILDDGPLPIARAIQIAHDIACGLAYAHLEGAVHGGLRPSNVMVSRSGLVKITDFGAAQLGRALLLSGARAGCLSYLSPEQVRGDALDHRCDLFSFGALFYEMLAHRPAFEGHSPKEISEKILHAKPPPPSELNPHVPRALDAIVLSMLAKQPANRMPGVPILLRDLERLEEGLGLALGATAVNDEPRTSVPPAWVEPGLQTPEPDGLREPVLVEPASRDLCAIEVPQHRGPIMVSGEFDSHRAMMQRESRPERSRRSRPALFAALALVLAVVGIGLAGLTDLMGLTGFMEYLSTLSERGVMTSRAPEAPATTPVASRPIPPSPVAAPITAPLTVTDATPASPPPELDKKQAEPDPAGILPSAESMAPKLLSTESDQPAQAEPLVADEFEQPAFVSAAPPQDGSRQMQAVAAAVPEQRPAATARLIVTISPRGEIYIDGKHHGTAPAVTTFDLTPGMHRIEVRSGSRPPYLTYMAVQAGDVRRIRHDFDAKPSLPAR